MSKKVRISFSKPWDVISKNFDDSENLCDKLLDNPQFATLDLLYEDEVLSKIIKLNKNNSEKLVRFFRLFYSPTYKRNSQEYMLQIKEAKLPLYLIGDPANYYDISIDCHACGYLKWQQKSNLKLKRAPKRNIEQTTNGEIIVSHKLKEQIENENLSGCQFRIVDSHPNTWQLYCTDYINILEAPFIEKEELCNSCLRPKRISLMQTNNVKYFFTSCSETALEVCHLPQIDSMTRDFNYSQIEIGTLTIPEGQKQGTFPAFKGSKPLMYTSSNFIKLLDELAPNDFDVISLNEERFDDISQYQYLIE